MSTLLRKCNAWMIAVFVLLCLPMVGWAQSSTKEAAKTAKVSPDLIEVMQNRGQAAPALIDGFAVETNQVFEGDKIAIEAVANNEDGQALLNQLRALGLTDGVAYRRMVFGYLPISKIGDLKNVPSLSFARSYQKPLTNTGSVTSQGDASLRADVARTTYGVTGAGVKVGVISDSYNRLGGAAAGVASGDLPVVEVVEESATTGNIDEGRAMAEIVHDVAPGAAIAFHTANGGQANFAQGILDLAAAGCQVIVDDIIYLAEPFFQDGIIGQAVNQVVNNNGATYFSSAGNRARVSYQAPYKSGGVYSNTALFGTDTAYPTHDFGSSGVDNLQNITIPAGGSLRLVFQWDNPFRSVSGGVGATTDLDILILNSTTGAVLNSSGTGDQTTGGDPVEITGTVTNTTGAPLNVNVIIVKYAGPDPGLIKWVNFGSTTIGIEYNTRSGASYGHNTAAGCISTGAAGWFDTPVFNGALTTAIIEPFSSAGGTPILFNPDGTRINGIVGTVRQKPEITAVDGGNNTFFGNDTSRDPDTFPNFFGTSAAAPHAAAVAALMKQKVPAITRNTILSTLQNTALDMDDPAFAGFETGFDFGTGFGFIQADRALQAISPAPNTAPTVANTIAPQSGTVGQAFTFTIPANTFADAETPGSLTISVSGLPPGLLFASGTITGTPSASGVSTVTVTATDPGSLSVSTTFQLTINPASVVVPPPGSFAITGVTTVSCATVTAGLRTVTFNPQYSGQNGQPVSFSVVNELSPTTAPGPYTLNLYTDNPVITLKATQSGTAEEASFAYNWLAACPGGTTPPPGSFAITGVTTVSCATVTAGLRTVTFNPQYSGQNGQPVSFSVVNELSPTTAPGPYTLNLYTDNPVITLKAIQSGTAGEASFTYNWLVACNTGSSSARLAARPGSESTAKLTVLLLPNPVSEEFAVDIQGAQGQAVQLQLTDVNGKLLTNTSIDVTTPEHRERLRFSQHRAGLYLLRVSTARQAVTLKVIKQ